MTDTSTTTDMTESTSLTSTNTNGAGPVTSPEPAVAGDALATAEAIPPTAAERLFATRTVLPGPPEVSPDGRWLAYLREDEPGSNALWLTPLDGGEARKVELPFVPVEDRDPDTGRQIRGPQWAPDGFFIALTGQDEDAETTSVWLVPTPEFAIARVTPETAPVGEASEPTTDAAADETTAEPETAGETASIVEPVAEEPEQVQEPAEPREPLKLLDHPFSDRSPRWSPDGTKIAFVHRTAGRDVIALIDVSDATDGVADILTWSERDDREPVWSRDGKFLAFTRQIPGERDHADIVVFVLESGEVKNLTAEKASAVRHSLDWVPGRNLVGYVTIEGDWLSISVINADNKAGWVVTRESGDKYDFRFAPGEARLTYIRSEGFATVVAERGLHASGAVAIDPGEGVSRYPRWVAEKRLAYGFSAPQKPFGFLAQDSLATAERTPLSVPDPAPVIGANLRHPLPFEYEPGPDEQFSGLVYRSHGHSGPVPAIVYVPDGPLATRLGEFQIEEQALANTGITVLTPVLHGAAGFGQAVIADLADLADHEVETSDLAEAGLALGAGDDVDQHKLALVGDGFGGTLALLTAGARPGIYSTVVAIDPIADWRLEFAEADPVWRTWLVEQYGLPRANPDRYALRTPETFAAVIDVPVLLVATENASPGRQQQFEQLTAYLDESGVSWERLDVPAQPRAQTLHQISQRLANRFFDGNLPVVSAEAPVDESAPEPEDGAPAQG
jgi:dipeptidyl aminopeptidase/acylaminoacyl peptidase